MTSFLFVDSRVPDIEVLLASLGEDVEVVLLDAGTDGVEQILLAVRGATNLASIHIVSHGSSGSLTLGSTILTEESLEDYRTELAQIGTSLSADGDLLLYGCDVGTGIVGRSFIETLSRYTAADVAASTDSTGSTVVDADWVLEASTGPIEAVAPFAASSQADYAYTLATVNDVSTTQLSGSTHIDALLDGGPGWNWLTPARNVIYYTFSVTSGTRAESSGIQGGLTAFNASQQTGVQTILNYVSQLTGIIFSPSGDGTAADLHFASTDINIGSFVSGLCSWSRSYSSNGSNVITEYSADAYVYLDNVEWGLQNAAPTPGGVGYETLLHEIGHALGLKHPFEGTPTLPAEQDNTANTVMSYIHSGGPYDTFGPYDVDALMWLYGGDGLGGALGLGGSGESSVSINDVSVTEGNSGTKLMTFTVTRSGGTAAFAVHYATADNTATAGSDYVATSNTLNFGSGVNTQTIAVTINGDTTFESDETFFVNLSGATSGATISDSQGVGNITNDDAAQGLHIVGNSGNDTLNGTDGDDRIEALGGDDALYGGRGADTLDGGSGIDSSAYSGNRTSYTITKTSTGFTVNGGADGTDTLTNIERLYFSDKSVALDISGNAGLTAKILGAVFGPSSVSSESYSKQYVGIGLSYLDGGMSYQDLTLLALNAKLGVGFSDTAEVNLLYQNLVGVAPSAADLDYWVGTITSEQFTQTSLAVMAGDHDLNTANINLVGLAQTGMEFI